MAGVLSAAVVCVLVALASVWMATSPLLSRVPANDAGEVNAPGKPPLRLFIAIGSAPQNAELRQAARDSWLQWISAGHTSYRFFTDVSDGSSALSAALDDEAATCGDLVRMPIESGYGSREHNLFLSRALYQMRWARDMYRFDYYLRIDDDAFLCLHRLQLELAYYPPRQFFMGRYWCKSGRHRADENFMLLSADVVALLSSSSPLLPLDERVTFAWNFGLYAYVLNLTVFDDQTRIDAQQGYLTDFMHHTDPASVDRDAEKYAGFCDRFLYAHHVRLGSVMRHVYERAVARVLYDSPSLRSAKQGCDASVQSFIPARHAQKLPNVIISARHDDGEHSDAASM